MRAARKNLGLHVEVGWNKNAEQEIRNYFYYIEDRYKDISVRELNLAKVQARNAAVKWMEKEDD